MAGRSAFSRHGQPPGPKHCRQNASGAQHYAAPSKRGRRRSGAFLGAERGGGVPLVQRQICPGSGPLAETIPCGVTLPFFFRPALILPFGIFQHVRLDYTPSSALQQRATRRDETVSYVVSPLRSRPTTPCPDSIRSFESGAPCSFDIPPSVPDISAITSSLASEVPSVENNCVG
mmetsp:Transcript_19692/g.39917  ORF Transcript_19692/g.39917 Transcript_19692/m.39917 type:complete len:175 (+) Transcript_19692:728-1252(+)